MIDFKIRRGLSNELFPEAGKVNPRLRIEEGCWYLCTDTADLYLGVNTGEELTLKRINDKASDTPTVEPGTVDELLEVYINENGELAALYSVSGEVILGSVVSKEYVDERISGIKVPEINLDDYAKKTDIPDVKDFVTKTELNNAINNIEHPIVDLKDYVTKDEIKDFINEIPAEYITEEELKDALDNIEHPVTPLEGYATEDFVTNAINNIKIPEDNLYKVDFNTPNYEKAVEAYNSGKILVLINASPDTNSYAVMNYVSEKYIAFTKFLMSRSCAYGVFNTYYLGSNNVWELAKEVKINKVEANVVGDTVGELTSIKIGKEIYSIPNTNGFATEAFVRNAIAEAELNGKDVDLTGYATKDEIKDLASTIYVDEKIASIKIPDSDLYKVDFNAPNFTEANAAYKAGKMLVLVNAAPDTSSYAVMNYVRADLITFTKFLTSRSEAYGSFNTYYLHSDNTWEVSKEVKLNKVEAITDVNNNINGIVIGQNTYDFDNFATNETINQINQNIENIQDTYVTNETLEQKNYVTTEHVTEQIETKVTEVIESKIEDGVITVNADSISYDTW